MRRGCGLHAKHRQPPLRRCPQPSLSPTRARTHARTHASHASHARRDGGFASSTAAPRAYLHSAGARVHVCAPAQVSRKGIVDAALLGCIPVLLHRGMAQQWPWHWGDWVTNATVTIDEADLLPGAAQATAHRSRAERGRQAETGREGEQQGSHHHHHHHYAPHDVIERLAAIPAERVASMRATLAANAHKLHYRALGRAADGGRDGGRDGGSDGGRDGGSDGGKPDGRGRERGNGGNGGEAAPRAPPLPNKDAFDVMMEASLGEARSEARRRDGALLQARAAASGVARDVAEHHAFALAAADGQCFGSTGDFGPQACAVGGPPRRGGAQFAPGVTSGAECVRRCERCRACGFASFSLLLRRCTWHRAGGCNISRLEKRWELWSYSTVQVQHPPQ